MSSADLSERLNFMKLSPDNQADVRAVKPGGQGGAALNCAPIDESWEEVR